MDSFHSRQHKNPPLVTIRPKKENLGQRLDLSLVQAGFATSRTEAKNLIAAGKVKIAGKVATKPTQCVLEKSSVQVDNADTFRGIP